VIDRRLVGTGTWAWSTYIGLFLAVALAPAMVCIPPETPAIRSTAPLTESWTPHPTSTCILTKSSMATHTQTIAILFYYAHFLKPYAFIFLFLFVNSFSERLRPLALAPLPLESPPLWLNPGHVTLHACILPTSSMATQTRTIVFYIMHYSGAHLKYWAVTRALSAVAYNTATPITSDCVENYTSQNLFRG